MWLLGHHPAAVLLRRKRRKRVHALLVLRGIRRRAHLGLLLPERVHRRRLLLDTRRSSHGLLLLAELLVRLSLLGHVRVSVEPAVERILGGHDQDSLCSEPSTRFLRFLRAPDGPADCSSVCLSVCSLSSGLSANAWSVPTPAGLSQRTYKQSHNAECETDDACLRERGPVCGSRR